MPQDTSSHGSGDKKKNRAARDKTCPAKNKKTAGIMSLTSVSADDADDRGLKSKICYGSFHQPWHKQPDR
jgi:hypothetical protein